MIKNNPRHIAASILNDFGISEPQNVEIEDIAYALKIPIRYVDLGGCEGRIIHKKGQSIITVNRSTEFESRKRFTLAHEIGHYLMHRNNLINHNDDISSLSWFNNKNRQKIFYQEFEANEFASELLLPTDKFISDVSGIPFSPELIRSISDKYRVSRTSTIHRFTEHGNHPICVFYTKNNKVHYWRKSEDFKYYIKDITTQKPPSDSVCAEYFNDNTIYSVDESKQEISKSTWLEVNEKYHDDVFYEFCLVHSSVKLAISVIWED
ncbi:MAG: ImmA/IrrE family metallo-endopeptidase [bacterium]